MRRFTTGLLALSLAVFLVGGAARADAVDDLVRAEMHRHHVPGLAFGVLMDGRLVGARGYGFANLEWHVKATPDTVFSLHSVSKQFTAAGILLLAERGKLTVDDPVSRYFPDAPASWKGITLRHLLSHTSGIPDYLNEPLNLNLPDSATDEDTVRAVMRLPLKFAPGERWSYCNTGYLMLGLVIRKVSGESATDFLRDNIFRPLGMKSSRAVSRDDVIPHRASKYIWKDDRWINAEFPFNTEQISDSGMLSTVRDLAQWDAALASGRILSAESRAAMWTSARLADGSSAGYGFGWFLSDWHGHRRQLHEGASFNGDRTLIVRFPDDHLDLIVLTNGGTPDFGALAAGIAGFFNPALALPVPPRHAS